MMGLVSAVYMWHITPCRGEAEMLGVMLWLQLWRTAWRPLGRLENVRAWRDESAAWVC
jgi:hypothetical protein